MAELYDVEYSLPKISDYAGNFDKWYKACDEIIENIPKNRMVGFPVADGQALYYIYSFSPLILQHIPYLDAYQIPYAHIRGLRKKDIERMISFEAMFS